MKRFNQLTEKQRTKALEYAMKEAEKGASMGVFGKRPMPYLLKEYAMDMAVHAWYPDFDDMVIDEIVEDTKVNF